jgi:UTP--glucose-1-phosphate uridylyltransferase
MPDTVRSPQFQHPDLSKQLAELEPALRARLDAAGFDADRLIRFAATLRASDPSTRRAMRNRVSGEVKAPAAGEIRTLAEGAERERLARFGQEAISRGELAFCVMAGGMATRMGGVVKALVEATVGKTFLDLRLAENRATSERAGRPVPLWLMTSDATDQPIREALAKAGAPAHTKTFTQDLGLRLTPTGLLFLDAERRPSTYATGHGDLVDALRRSGLLSAFRKGGGKAVWIANLDNLGASIDTAILGAFLENGAQLAVEVCDKRQNDRGGIPVHAQGRLQVLEEFRLPPAFDAAQVRVFNTNTFLARADALEAAPLTWTYFEVEKAVEGRPAIQFERLLQELTAHLDAIYLRVPRDGAASRFLPVKDTDELARRKGEIEAVARARGML